MTLFDLDSLVRDTSQENLYDLFNKTYIDYQGFQPQEYVVQQDEEMRIDLICFRLYESTNYVDFLLNFNYIDNPLNIKRGDIIRYIDTANFEEFQNKETDLPAVTNDLINANKGTRQDPARKQFLEQGSTLPPNFREEPRPAVRIENNNLVIS